MRRGAGRRHPMTQRNSRSLLGSKLGKCLKCNLNTSSASYPHHADSTSASLASAHNGRKQEDLSHPGSIVRCTLIKYRAGLARENAAHILKWRTKEVAQGYRSQCHCVCARLSPRLNHVFEHFLNTHTKHNTRQTRFCLHERRYIGTIIAATLAYAEYELYYQHIYKIK